MRKANVAVDIDWHQALNAIEKMLMSCSKEDQVRFTPMDVQRLSDAAHCIQEFIGIRAETEEVFRSCFNDAKYYTYNVHDTDELHRCLAGETPYICTFRGRKIAYVE